MCINLKRKCDVLLHAKPVNRDACMKYLNAQVILPDALVKELQNYVQGAYVYVPVQPELQKRYFHGRSVRKILPVSIYHSEDHISEITIRGCQAQPLKNSLQKLLDKNLSIAYNNICT